jgi:hypothetical protein
LAGDERRSIIPQTIVFLLPAFPVEVHEPGRNHFDAAGL